MNSLNLFLSNFHFLRPYWLLALLALFLVLRLLKKHRFYQSPWQQFLPTHLSQVLVEGNASTNNKSSSKKRFLLKPFIIGFLTIIALAGPVWEKLPQPLYQTERGSVLIMDMSYSMYATDVKPNRLTRSRFKAIDLLNKINEGDTGLIAYAGDAFIISPLTQDIKNITLLLPSLTPEIMPTPGANPLAALILAHKMLINAGHLNGDIYWFTDDIDNNEMADIYDWSNEFGHQLNILGVGSESGAPITLPSGELLKDNSGAIIIPHLPSQRLLSLASRGQGNYQTIKNDDSDIDNLILKNDMHEKNKKDKQNNQQTGDQWQEQGAWLLVIVLPLILSYFRRGSALLILPLTCMHLLFLLSFSLTTAPSFAATTAAINNDINSTEQDDQQSTPSTITNKSKKLWQNLWQTNDQQAQQHYNQENYQGAAEQFENSQWQGSAHYKAGNYEEALNAFKQGEEASSATSLYNQGNALAQMQAFEQAIESYEKALAQDPDLQDAKDNIEKIKQQQKQQEQQEQQEQQQGDQSKKDDSQEDNKDKQEQGDNQDKPSQSQDEQSSDDQSQAQQSQEKNEPNDTKNNDKEQNGESEDANQEPQEKESEQKQSNANKTQEQVEQEEKKTASQIAAEQQEKETDQKHQQLLNKVTDDPYLLLRNKMQIEYQKRKQNGATRGVNKQW